MCLEVYTYIGGTQGSNLNEMTAKMTGKTVTAGPVEATAIGNILIQLMADGEISSVKDVCYI